jgi:hypothetical protein
MRTNRILLISSRGFILFSALCLLAVSLMAFADPQAVMNLVHVQLNNTDAFSSIRGVYGGVGLTLFISLLYLMRRETQKGLVFLCLLWGFYALSRTITIFAEGALGDFGTQWLITETAFFFIALTLWVLNRKAASSAVSY